MTQYGHMSPAQSPPVMSREFMDRALRFQPSDNPDEATAQTVDIMCGLIERSANDPLLKDAASTALFRYRGGGPLWAVRGIDPFQAGDSSLRAQAFCEAVWWYCKHQLKFVHHSKQIDVWLNERDQLQLLIEPGVLLRFPFRMEGDCAIYTMLICAMLQVLGITWEIVTAAVKPSQPDIFSHVWPRAVLPNGRRLDLDASHGNYPGWSVPLNHRFRVQVWDENGFPMQDFGEQRFNGLHGYQLRRGFGDDSSDTIDFGASSGTVTSGTDLSSTFATYIDPSVVAGAGAGQTPDQLYQALLAGGSLGTDSSTGLQTWAPSGSRLGRVRGAVSILDCLGQLRGCFGEVGYDAGPDQRHPAGHGRFGEWGHSPTVTGLCGPCW